MMFLPPNVEECIHRLEEAGFQAWAVGGCVRDSLLGLTPQDYDLCTDALPEQTVRVFSDRKLVLAGTKHGTVGVVTENGVVEITTFRAEGAYADSRHPDWVRFVPRVEEDLARRDFTVNAMAYSPSRGFADPFGGQQDLKRGILRCVGDPDTRFREDALRILRGARFAVRFRLAPEEATEKAMFRLSPLLDRLARERVFDELCKLLPLVTAPDLIRFAPVLASAIPELAPMVGFDQHSPHHAYDVYTHTAYVTAAVTADLPLRWAALLHDVGKIPCFTRDDTGRGHFIGHAPTGARMAEDILLRLKAPTALRERVVLLISLHMTPLTEDRKLLRRRLSKYGAETVMQLLDLQRADASGKGTDEPRREFGRIAALISEILEEASCLTLRDLAVDGNDLMALGLKGRQIGQCLDSLLAQVLDERLPNEKQALLAAANHKDLHGGLH